MRKAPSHSSSSSSLWHSKGPHPHTGGWEESYQTSHCPSSVNSTPTHTHKQPSFDQLLGHGVSLLVVRSTLGSKSWEGMGRCLPIPGSRSEPSGQGILEPQLLRHLSGRPCLLGPSDLSWAGKESELSPPKCKASLSCSDLDVRVVLTSSISLRKYLRF